MKKSGPRKATGWILVVICKGDIALLTGGRMSHSVQWLKDPHFSRIRNSKTAVFSTHEEAVLIADKIRKQYHGLGRRLEVLPVAMVPSLPVQ